MKNKNTEKTEFLKIVYFDEAAAQDYVDVTNGGRLDWSTQENKEKIAKIVAEIEAQAKSGFTSALLYMQFHLPVSCDLRCCSRF